MLNHEYATEEIVVELVQLVNLEIIILTIDMRKSLLVSF